MLEARFGENLQVLGFNFGAVRYCPNLGPQVTLKPFAS